MVEFDPASQWFAVATTIAAKMILGNLHVGYGDFGRPVDDVKRDLSALGIDVPQALRNGTLLVDDAFSVTLFGGRREGEIFEPMEGGVRFNSLRATDISGEWAKWVTRGMQQPHAWQILSTWPPGSMYIADSLSVLLRYNDERIFAEFAESRLFAEGRTSKRIDLSGIVRGIHSQQLYGRLEAACEGVIDIQAKELEGQVKNFMRIRNLRGQQHDSSWHEIEIKPNGEAVITAPK